MESVPLAEHKQVLADVQALNLTNSQMKLQFEEQMQRTHQSNEQQSLNARSQIDQAAKILEQKQETIN